jgi:hypothetical protein
MEVFMRVEVTVKVDGRVVKTHLEEVSGTLEQMEEKIHALGKRVAGNALQATVQAVVPPRPLFRKRAGRSGTKDTSPGR